ncbi:MAG: SDR family oxidoreductase [Alphaproteobacteria bacterium]|jgi:NAD(P)-dependent dehydrogenase (short-subunit alcohol dehydrogenase family)|nr:SDR family oxidoreductase [Alphaproteobacteria bacterium]
MTLPTRHALITGASIRIGRAITQGLAQNGWNLTLHYNTSQKEAQALAHELQHSFGVQTKTIQADLNDEKQVARFLNDKNESAMSPVTAIVHAACLFERDEKDPDGSRHQRVNFLAPQILDRAFAAQCPNDAKGSILYFLDNTPMPDFLSHYSLSKTSIREMIAPRALELAPSLRLNALALGPILKNQRESDEHFQKLILRTPLRHKNPVDDVVKAAFFLLDNTSITGQILNVDSGMHLLGKDITV